jgi:hypothetical protein
LPATPANRKNTLGALAALPPTTKARLFEMLRDRFEPFRKPLDA